MSAPPQQRPGSSKQDYATPPELLDAVRERLVIEQFTIDLAADAENAVCDRYYSLLDSAFNHEWDHEGWGWCNMPFGDIPRFVKKASESPSNNALLVPASIGANWWRDFVHGQARILALNGRVTFGSWEYGNWVPMETGTYPKDCAILLYGPGIEPAYEVWTWG